MFKDVIIKAFEKAEQEIIGSSNKTSKSNHISDVLMGKYHHQLGGKTLRNYYDKVVELDINTDIEIKSIFIQYLCEYLDYKDYQHFLKENPPENENSNYFISNINKKKTTIGSIIIALLISYFGYDMAKKNCMVWVGNNHFERVKCEEKSELKTIPYNKVIFDNLKRVEPDCNYQFFKRDGSENLWYGKSVQGELEFFTYYGLHPITNDTLDPITQYMIDKYICNE